MDQGTTNQLQRQMTLIESISAVRRNINQDFDALISYVAVMESDNMRLRSELAQLKAKNDSATPNS